ncbi:MAG: PilZ domain-containing protein [Caulobacterales bacterium]
MEPVHGSHANDNKPPAGERRTHRRRRVLLSGKVAYADNSFTADCTIRNLSEGGALIVTGGTPLPKDPFLIVIKHDGLHEARTAWQYGSTQGLEFLRSWSLASGAPAKLAPLRHLWLELQPR